MEGPKILTLMLEARLEVYKFIDSQYKPMPKKADGSNDEYAKVLCHQNQRNENWSKYRVF